MTSFTTFYLSRVIGAKAVDAHGKFIGIVKDLLIDVNYSQQSSERALVSGIKLKYKNKTAVYSFLYFEVEKIKGKIKVTCEQLEQLPADSINNGLFLADVFLDKQIVDLNGRKLVRVNDVRLVSLKELEVKSWELGVSGNSELKTPNSKLRTQNKEATYAIAVDIGVEGLLRRIGIAKLLKPVLSFFGIRIPAKFILWEDVEDVDFSNMNIKLSKSSSKLHTLHPSDLADILEDLGKKSSTHVFSSLDEEKAADVLEELDPKTQIHIVESLSVEKAADVLEKMPADEVADILDVLEDEKAELLLKEMEKDSSEEVRELLEYPNNTVGSIMTTDVLSFKENKTVEEVLHELRTKKPEAEALYNLFVTDEKEELIATFSLRDVVVSQPDRKIAQIMKRSFVSLHDEQEIDEIAEIISKYNLLAIPVVDSKGILQGMVVIDDVVEDLINKRRTNK